MFVIFLISLFCFVYLQLGKQIHVASTDTITLQNEGINELTLGFMVTEDSSGEVIDYQVYPDATAPRDGQTFFECKTAFPPLRFKRTIPVSIQQDAHTIKRLPYWSRFSNEEYITAVNSVIQCIRDELAKEK